MPSSAGICLRACRKVCVDGQFYHLWFIWGSVITAPLIGITLGRMATGGRGSRWMIIHQEEITDL